MAAKENAFQKMVMQEIEQRASLFRDLKRGKAYARKRILQNLKWEFDSLPSQALEKKVDEIISRVYAR